MNMKTNNAEKQIAKVLKILGSPFRIKLLYAIGYGESCVCHLEVVLKKRQAYISQHLMVMRDAGLLVTRREGKYIYYRVANEKIFKMLDGVVTLNNSSSENVPKVAANVRVELCPCPKCES